MPQENGPPQPGAMMPVLRRPPWGGGRRKDRSWASAPTVGRRLGSNGAPGGQCSACRHASAGRASAVRASAVRASAVRCCAGQCRPTSPAPGRRRARLRVSSPASVKASKSGHVEARRPVAVSICRRTTRATYEFYPESVDRWSRRRRSARTTRPDLRSSTSGPQLPGRPGGRDGPALEPAADCLAGTSSSGPTARRETWWSSSSASSARSTGTKRWSWKYPAITLQLMPACGQQRRNHSRQPDRVQARAHAKGDHGRHVVVTPARHHQRRPFRTTTVKPSSSRMVAIGLHIQQGPAHRAEHKLAGSPVRLEVAE